MLPINIDIAAYDRRIDINSIPMEMNLEIEDSNCSYVLFCIKTVFVSFLPYS